ncbi:hypothetical protein ACFY0G_32935 [Streptomyces sp. NPDC001552]|uniref:hypothetical protein n=1 Tax=Streptomyces sp. NPDC001552 TaxID=3364587 RepID=UPI00369A4BB8
MESNMWASTLIGLAFLALVAFTVRLAADHEDVEQLWSIVGLIVGVAVGVIPSFFFAGQADVSEKKAQAAEKKAEEVEKGARGLALEVSPARADTVRQQYPEIFAVDSRG